jgi:hypothetical protein
MDREKETKSMCWALGKLSLVANSFPSFDSKVKTHVFKTCDASVEEN